MLTWEALAQRLRAPSPQKTRNPRKSTRPKSQFSRDGVAVRARGTGPAAPLPAIKPPLPWPAHRARLQVFHGFISDVHYFLSSSEASQVTVRKRTLVQIRKGSQGFQLQESRQGRTI